MNFFKILGICFGLVAFLKPFYMHFLPWDEKVILSGAYTKKRPNWVFLVALSGLLLVSFTWYKELTTSIPGSLVITLLFSITAIKAMILISNYSRFQKWIGQLLSKEENKKLVKMDITVGLFGLLILIFSIFFL